MRAIHSWRSVFSGFKPGGVRAGQGPRGASRRSRPQSRASLGAPGRRTALQSKTPSTPCGEPTAGPTSILAGGAKRAPVHELTARNFVWEISPQGLSPVRQRGRGGGCSSSRSRRSFRQRPEAGRPEAVAAGTVLLAGTGEEEVYAVGRRLLADEELYARMAKAVNPYGDGRAALRIKEAILYSFGLSPLRPAPFGPRGDETASQADLRS